MKLATIAESTSKMNINVPVDAQKEFWDDHQAEEEFWAFRFKPPCQVGTEITFRFNKKPVATGIVSRIEAPGQSACGHSGRFTNRWKVVWNNSSFKRLA